MRRNNCCCGLSILHCILYYTSEYILTQVTDIVSSIASYHTIARHFLNRGLVIDAVTVCSRVEHKLAGKKQQHEQMKNKELGDAAIHEPTHVQHENALTGEEVFRAAIEHAKNGCDSRESLCTSGLFATGIVLPVA